MNGSSPNQLFPKSWQRPGNLAMMASVVAHGFLFAGLAMVVPATGQQTAKKQLRVVSLLQTPPNQPAQTNQPVDPNAPPPAPGVAGLPLNITTPDGLAELPVTNTPNPAFDPFASSVVELSPSQQASLPPVNSGPPATPPSQPDSSPDAAAQSQSAQKGPSLSDKDFQDWLNGTTNLPNVSPDPGATGSPSSPEIPSGPVARNGSRPNLPTLQGEDGSSSNPDNSPNPDPRPKDNFVRIPGETVKRSVAYNYPQAACKDRLEGQAEYRIWVSSQATPVVSDIVSSTNSDILDREVKVAAQKYKITAEDTNKLVILPFDFKYSQKTCEAKEKESPSPSLDPDPPQSTPTPTPPTPNPTEPTTDSKGEKDDPAGKDSPSQPLSPQLPDGPQSEEPVVQPTLAPQPVAPQPVAPQPSPSDQLQPSPPAVQPPAAPSPTPEPVQPAVPLKAPPSNSDLPPSVPPADPGSLDDIQPAPTTPPAAETDPSAETTSPAETDPPVVDDSETN